MTSDDTWLPLWQQNTWATAQREQSCHSCQAEALVWLLLIKIKAWVGEINSTLISTKVQTPPTWHGHKLSPSSPKVIKRLFATFPNHDRKVEKAAEPQLQSPRLIYCDSDSCLYGCMPVWKWARIHWGELGSLNTLNEGLSVRRLNVCEDADTWEGNVSSQEASSGSRWRQSESGALFHINHKGECWCVTKCEAAYNAHLLLLFIC